MSSSCCIVSRTFSHHNQKTHEKGGKKPEKRVRFFRRGNNYGLRFMVCLQSGLLTSNNNLETLMEIICVEDEKNEEGQPKKLFVVHNPDVKGLQAHMPTVR